MKPPYEQSIAILKEHVAIIGEALASLDRRPQHDDEVLGPSIFRMSVADVSLDGLTLPCLYVGRSELNRVSFASTDLHLSTMNWSDVLECDFSGAILTAADLRACQFQKCRFREADLSDADLRGSSFEDCVFEGAIMRGAKLYRPPKRFGLWREPGQESLPLSADQRAEIAWCEDAPEPGGG
jgi:uncharacterized protein YjbI with pentapeptide repeats